MTAAQKPVFILQADAHAFASAVAEQGARAAIKQFGKDAPSSSSLSRTTLRDPTRSGYKGAYPTIKGKARPGITDDLYEGNGAWAAIVDGYADDTWSEGYVLRSKDEAWVKAAEAELKRLCADHVLKEADRDVLQHGHGVIRFVLSDQTGDPSLEPSGRIEVKRLESIPATDVSEPLVETDPKKPNYDEVLSYRVALAGGPKDVHPMRLLTMREFPKRRKRLEGIPRARRSLADVIGYENVKWAGYEAFYQRAAPMLQFVFDKDAVMGPKDVAALHKNVDSLQSGVIQKVVLEGGRLETVSGSSTIANPQVAAEVAIQSVALSARMPIHLLKGSAAGELSSSSEDSRRWNQRISRRQENYAATQGVVPLLQRLADFNVLPPVPEDLVVEWRLLDEPTEKEVFEAELARGSALQAFKNAGVLPPEQISDYEGKAAPTDAEAVAQKQAAAAALANPKEPQEPMEDHAHEAPALPDDEQLEDPLLKPVRRRAELAIRVEFHDWLEQFLALFNADDRVEPVPGQEASADDPLVAAVLALDLDTDDLEDVLFTLYSAAAAVGASQSFKALGRKEVFKLIDDTDVRAFKTLGSTVAANQARLVTARVRQSLADGLVQGESLGQLRNRVIEAVEIAAPHAEVIARTESMRAYNFGSAAAMKRAGLERYEFRALDAACPFCAPLDGQIFQFSDGVPPASTHPQCRCQILPVLADVAPEAKVSAENYRTMVTKRRRGKLKK